MRFNERSLAVVLSVTLSRVAEPVYNIEVHGEHVYQVGELGVLVHNACETATLINGGSFLLANSTSSGMVRLSGSSVRVAGAYVQGHASTDHFLGRLREIANKFGMQEVVFENVYFLNFSLRDQIANHAGLIMNKVGDGPFGEIWDIVWKIN